MLKAPIVHALRGKEHVEWDNPFDVGMTGLIGFSSGYFAMEDCDALLLLGTNFPYRQFYPEEGADRAGRHPAGAIGAARRGSTSALVGDVGATIDALLPLLTEKTRRRPSSMRARDHYPKARQSLDELAAGSRPQADPPAARGAGCQRACRRRRDLHLRRRAADRVGRALSEDERQAAG